MDTSGGPPGARKRRCRVGDLHLGFAVEKEVVREHAQWRDPRVTEQWNAVVASSLEGAGAVISARTADQ